MSFSIEYLRKYVICRDAMFATAQLLPLDVMSRVFICLSTRLQQQATTHTHTQTSRRRAPYRWRHCAVTREIIPFSSSASAPATGDKPSDDRPRRRRYACRQHRQTDRHDNTATIFILPNSGMPEGQKSIEAGNHKDMYKQIYNTNVQTLYRLPAPLKLRPHGAV